MRFWPRKDPEERSWAKKQEAAHPSRYYGDGGTIHSSGDLDIEIRDGKVVSVWFRCQMLPFRQADVDQKRAEEMNRVYKEGIGCVLTGVEILDTPRSKDKTK